MSTLSPALPERPHRPPPSKTALQRSFLVLEVDETAPPTAPMTNAQALALLGARTSRWVIVLRRAGDGLHFHAAPRTTLAALLQRLPADDSMAETLRSDLAESQVLTPAQYQATALLGAVVVDDDVPIGVTEAIDKKGWGAGAAPRPRPTESPEDEGARGWGAYGVDSGWNAGFGRVGVPPPPRPIFRGGGRVVPPPAPPLPTAPEADAVRPHRLEALMPSEVTEEQTVALVVSLERIAAAQAAAGDVPLGAGESLDIVVQPGAGLHLDGSNTLPLFAPTDAVASEVTFFLQGTAPGDTSVKVYAFHDARSVARMTLPVRVVAAGAAQPAPRAAVAAASLPAAPATHPPDLCLLVIEGNGEIRFQLRGRKEGVVDYPASTAEDSRTYFRQFAAAIEGLGIRSPEKQKSARLKLQAWGAGLFEKLVPPGLQQLLWERQGQGNVTVQICSDEAWIPWEACRLTHLGADGRVQGGPFLAEAFAMTRWLHGTAAPDRFRFRRCALVVPTTSALTTSEAERTFYKSLASDTRHVEDVPPTLGSFMEALVSGTYDAWHFCGHGNAGAPGQGDRATLRLDDDSMSADLFAGEAENALLTRPFIFFNACQSAAGDYSLTGVGGWAHRFIRPNWEQRGAAVFIGTYWSVYDDAAHRFATTLYPLLLDKRLPIGDAVRQARLQAQGGAGGAPSDPLSWLAYTVYADPLAVAEFDEGPQPASPPAPEPI
jgi:hypothetical protein